MRSLSDCSSKLRHHQNWTLNCIAFFLKTRLVYQIPRSAVNADFQKDQKNQYGETMEQYTIIRFAAYAAAGAAPATGATSHGVGGTPITNAHFEDRRGIS